MNNRNKSIVFGALLVLVTVALAEGAWRTLQYFVSGISPVGMLPNYRNQRFVLSPFLAFGPRVDWQIPGKPNPATAYFNSQGFRTKERLGPKPSGEVRIVALGGSTTEDVWNEDGLHWPLWTERQLQKSGFSGVRVYNTAMSAYSSAHTLVRLAFDVLDYEPDFVLVMHNINDLTVNYRAALERTRVDPHYRVTFARKSFTGDLDESDVVISRLALAIRARVDAATRHDEIVPDTYPIADGLRYFQRNLQSIDALVSDRGAALVLLTMPSCDSERVYRQVELHGRRQFSAPLPLSFQSFNRDFDAYNEAIRRVASARRVPMVDMTRLFGRDERFFSDFVHYNAAGSRRFGELLAEQLTPMVRNLLAQRPLGGDDRR